MDDAPAAQRAREDGQRNGLPLFSVPEGAKTLRTEDVRRGEDEP